LKSRWEKRAGDHSSIGGYSCFQKQPIFFSAIVRNCEKMKVSPAE